MSGRMHRAFTGSRALRGLRGALIGITTGLFGDAVGMSTLNQYIAIVALVGVAFCNDEMADRRSKR